MKLKIQNLTLKTALQSTIGNRKSKIAALLCLAALASVPSAALAQFSTGEDIVVKPPWQQFKLPKKTVSLDFRNASPDMVLSFFSKASGIAIVKDPTLTKGLTIQSPKPITLNEAFSLLNAVLDLSGFEMRKQGNIIVVAQKSQGGNR